MTAEQALWRQGRRVPEHVYRDGKPVGTYPADLAAEIVAGMNAYAALSAARAGDGRGDHVDTIGPDKMPGASASPSDHPAEPETGTGSALMGESPSRRTVEDRNALAAFARDVLSEFDDVDGGTLQDLGVRHGLLREEAFDPGRHEDTGFDATPGSPIYFLTDRCAPLRVSDGSGAPALPSGSRPADAAPTGQPGSAASILRAGATPGPWSIYVNEHAHGVAIVGSQKGSIGAAWPSDLLGNKLNAEANARLMAAAPELLDALIGVVRVADRKTVEFDTARAAIAKATGGQP